MGPTRLYERWQRWCNGLENNQESPDLSTVLCRYVKQLEKLYHYTDRNCSEDLAVRL